MHKLTQPTQPIVVSELQEGVMRTAPISNAEGSDVLYLHLSVCVRYKSATD